MMKAKPRLLIFAVMSALILTGCNEDVQILRQEVDEGQQVPVKADELEVGVYYIKDGTNFIKTLPLFGSGKNTSHAMNSSGSINKAQVLYAAPKKDTLIPTHYKGEVVVQASKAEDWDDVYLERYKDMGYSVGFYNAEYSSEDGALTFKLGEGGIKETDFYEKVKELESDEIKIIEVDHKTLTEENTDLDSGILINMEQGETYTLSLYAGTYYHEIDVVADTQMFQLFELYEYDKNYISDTKNGYKNFLTPEVLKSGYYAINGEGLFRYVSYEKGKGDTAKTDYNEKYYENESDILAQFSSLYSFTLDSRVSNLTIAALYDENTIDDEDEIKGFIFAPDGTEYEMTLDTKKNTLKTDFTEAMPGKWTVNIQPKTLTIKAFDAVDNSPDQELTQKEYTITLEENKENLVFKAYFESRANEDIGSIIITGSIITPGGETYIMEKGTEKELDGSERMYLSYIMPFASEGSYTIDINYYPEKTSVEEPYTENNTETVTETIIIEG